MEDVEGREYVVLDAQIERITDPKRSFAFTVKLRGIPEPLCFGTEDESVMNEWISKLESASVSKRKFRAVLGILCTVQPRPVCMYTLALRGK